MKSYKQNKKTNIRGFFGNPLVQIADLSGFLGNSWNRGNSIISGKLYIVHWMELEARKHRILNKVQYKIKDEWINPPKHLKKEFPFIKNDQE